MRKELHSLKTAGAPIANICRASQALHRVFRAKAKVIVKDSGLTDRTESKQNNWHYKLNLCKFIKSFEQQDIISQTFNTNTCEHYFQDILCEKHPDRIFETPAWMPKINTPVFPMLHSEFPPDFQDVSKIVQQ